MALARIKTWIAGEVLTAAALNAEFDNITDNFLSPSAAETITGAWTFSNGATINGTLTLGTALPIASGGTGATTAAAARTALGLGTMALENIAAIGAATFASSATFNSVTLYDEVVALTDAATITIDLSTGNLFEVTLGGNRTLDFTNLNEGVFIVVVKQPGAGGPHTLTHDAAEKWPGGTEPTLSTGANDIDILTYFCDGTTLYGTSSLDYS